MADRLSQLLPERELLVAHFGYRWPQPLQDREAGVVEIVGLLRNLRLPDSTAHAPLDRYLGNSNHPESPLYIGRFLQRLQRGYFARESR